MIKLKERPYRVQAAGEGLKVKLPGNWISSQGWEPGELVYLCTLGEGDPGLIVSKKMPKKGTCAGQYVISQDKTIYLPSCIRNKLELVKGSELFVYANQGEIIYLKGAENGE